MTDMQEPVALYGDHGFPAAIAPKGNIPNLADVAGRRIGAHGFGLTLQGAATALRLLADQIDAGAVIPQKMGDATEAAVDDFTLRTLTFTFAARHADESTK